MSLNAQKTREFSPNVLRRIKLRTRLFVTFLIISLVPVITIGIFSYHASAALVRASGNVPHRKRSSHRSPTVLCIAYAW